VNPCFCYRGLIVDIVRRLWDRGLYKDNKWLKIVHANWFSYWVDYKACLTMQDADTQIKGLLETSQVDKPIFTEANEGETQLGGEMRLRAPWIDVDD
jgi:hypothetical protein